MQVQEQVGTLWFTDVRVRVVLAEDRLELVEAEAREGNMPPLHVHHEDDEAFYVLDGRLSVITADGATTLEAGEALLAPRGVPHTYRVESETARWLVGSLPGRFGSFVREVSVPAEGDGYLAAERMPEPGGLVAAAARYGIEILGPPGALPAVPRTNRGA